MKEQIDFVEMNYEDIEKTYPLTKKSVAYMLGTLQSCLEGTRPDPETELGKSLKASKKLGQIIQLATGSDLILASHVVFALCLALTIELEQQLAMLGLEEQFNNVSRK